MSINDFIDMWIFLLAIGIFAYMIIIAVWVIYSIQENRKIKRAIKEFERFEDELKWLKHKDDKIPYVKKSERAKTSHGS